MTERKNSDLIPQAEEKVENKGLDFLKFEHMTLFVDLPSGGEVYPEDSLLRSGKVEISQMLAPHEEILSNTSYLRNGVMFDKLVDSLLVNKDISALEFISGDKTAILIAARRDAYGPNYKVNFICSKCGSTYSDEINLDENIVNHVGKPDDNVIRENGLIHIKKLPRSGVSLKIKILTGIEDKRLFDYSMQKKKEGKEVTTLDQYRLMFKEVAGHTDTQMINQFIDKMPAMDSKYIKNVYKKMAPDVKMVKLSTCEHCGNVEEKEAVFNTEFFWPSDE